MEEQTRQVDRKAIARMGAAVSHIHLAAVWRFNREPLSTVYERALISLGESLARKGMV
jgi:hypothetical protein